LNGEIKPDSAARLEEFLNYNGIPGESEIVLNSPGGSLLGGIELGRLIRNYRLRTDVGKLKSTNWPPEIEPGVCFSSCSLAFVGGQFRYLKDGSRLGIHRFSFAAPQEKESELAQVASATVVSYLREMGIDSDFFALSTEVGSNDIYEPTKPILKQLNVINDGITKTTWTVEGTSGSLHLKGERDTVFGLNKFILACPTKIYCFLLFSIRRSTEMRLLTH
jgi:hypothetical protein